LTDISKEPSVLQVGNNMYVREELRDHTEAPYLENEHWTSG
jgi:hypothetical protein